MDTQSSTSTAPDGDVVTETNATASTPSTSTKTEPAAPDRSKTMPADAGTDHAQPINRGEIQPNKKG